MEKLEEVLEQYEVNVKRSYRGRQMTLYETNDQLYALAEYHGSLTRLEREQYIKEYLIDHGFENVDQYVVNKNGEYITEDRYHTPFIMKKYYAGKECDITKMQDVFWGAKNLALLHEASMGVEQGLDLELKVLTTRQQLEKRTRELKRVRSYISKLKRKQEFEQYYMNHYDHFFQEALYATSQLPQLESMEEKLDQGFCHGGYQHHCILKMGGEMATVAFDQYSFGKQLWDLYNFLRKVLEKNNYQFDYGKKVLEGYDRGRKLRLVDYEYCYIMMLYPEKFWKISNHYFNTKKTWVPPKTVEKLKKVVQQNQERQKFLLKFEEEYLHG